MKKNVRSRKKKNRRQNKSEEEYFGQKLETAPYGFNSRLNDLEPHFLPFAANAT